MDSTNVNSSETVTFVICGADKELKIEGKGIHSFDGPYSDKEIKAYVNNIKTAELERRTIPMSCEKYIDELKNQKHKKSKTKELEK